MSRSHHLIAFLLVCFVSFFKATPPFAQNLVPNPSLEDYIVCPSSYGSGGPLLAPPWSSATQGSTDYLNSCSTSASVDIPHNTFGWQLAHTGEAYAGGYFYIDGTNGIREYLLAPLLEPLEANVAYEVSFWVSCSESGCGIKEIGAFLSVNPPPFQTFFELQDDPQIESTIGYVSDTMNWQLISGCFIAAGGEAYITIGNFYNNTNTHIDTACTLQYVTAYYYIDDVSVQAIGPPENIDIDLDDEIFACNEYLIDPEIDGVDFLWSDGSSDSTLLVNESGLYGLTITNGCARGKDSVEITIGLEHYVELGPGVANVCINNPLTISLDPTIGNYEWQDGSTDPEYTISTPGLYSVTLNDDCVISTDQIQVNFFDEIATDFLGNDKPLCPGDQVLLSFDLGIGDFNWQNGSSDSYLYIDLPGIYSVTISNACGDFTDDIEIIETHFPVIDFGADTLLLCDLETTQLSLDPLAGDYLWQDDSTDPNYTITLPGIYSVTLTNACGIVADYVLVIHENTPILSFGPDTTICSSQLPITLITTDPNATSYLWNDNSTDSSFAVTMSGQYALTVSNACGMTSDTILITTIDSVSVFDLGADINLCPGEHVVLHAPSQPGNYLWQDGSTADSLIVVTAGNYALTITNSCSTKSDAIIVTADATSPMLILPQSIDLCASDTIAITSNLGGVEYLWNNGAQTESIEVTLPGTYILSVTNACGSDADTVVVNDAGDIPSIFLGPDLSLCLGDQVTIHPISSGVSMWQWSNGSFADTFNVTAPGIVAIEVTNICGEAVDTLLVTYLPAVPVLQLGADTSLCSNEELSLNINLNDVEILWSTGSIASGIVIQDPGVYFATITTSCGSSIDSIIVTPLPDIPLLDLGPDFSLCPGDLVTIDPGLSNVDYVWQDGSNNSFFTVTNAAEIILVISNSCGNAVDTLFITESTEGPQVDLGPDINTCQGDTILLTAGIGGVNYLWQDGSVNPEYSVFNSGVYFLEISNSCGTDIDSVSVVFNGLQPTPYLGQDTTLCEGQVLNLHLSSSTDIIKWQDGTTANSFEVNTPGQYFVQQENECGIGYDSIDIAYQVIPSPFDLGRDTLLCPGESILLLAPLTNDLLTWQDGSHENNFKASVQGVYSLEWSNRCGVSYDSLELRVDADVPVIEIDKQINWCIGETVLLDATQSFDANYLWSTGETNSILSANAPGNYDISITTACYNIDYTIEIIEDANCDANIFIPNIFSPNDDQINDDFSISHGDGLIINSLSCTIFDRWGNQVFHSKDVDFTWNGSFNDKPLQPGVYVYVIHLVDLVDGINHSRILTGDLTLVK
jgi:gliding motility-associated-like protein